MTDQNTAHVLRCVRDYIKVVPCTCQANQGGVPVFTCWKHVFEYNMGFVDAAAPDSAHPDTLRLDLLESTHAFIHVSLPPDATPVFTVIANNITAHGTTLRAACDAALKL